MRINILVLLLVSYISVFSQSYPEKYWVKLTNKDNTGYDIAHPEDFLSQRAIDRRNRYNIDIVENDLPVSQVYIDSLQALGCEVVLKSKWLNAVTIASTDTAFLDTIEHLGFVEHIDRFANQLKETSVSISGIKQIEDFYDYGNGYDQIHIHNGEILHNNGYRGEGMLIGILDAGFMNVDQIDGFSHLFTDNRVIATRNIVSGTDHVYGYHTHGTMVLSTIASYLPGEFIGTAPMASFVFIRTEDASTEYIIEEDYWISGIEYADSLGVDVVNSSLGYTTFNDPRQNHTYADLNGKTARASIAATIAATKGIAVVNSAGNEGSTSWKYIGVPADADSILTVGAINSSGDIASFSSKGATSDGRLKPNVVAVGSNATLLDAGGYVTSNSGTSFSSPITAGLVACLWQAKQSLNNIELFDIIQESSSRYLNPDTAYGYGIPDYSEALLHIQRLNGFSSKDEFIYTSAKPIENEISFTLYSSQNQEITIGLYDMLGRTIYFTNEKVYMYSENNFTINNLKNTYAGILILKVTTDTETFEMKLVK